MLHVRSAPCALVVLGAAALAASSAAVSQQRVPPGAQPGTAERQLQQPPQPVLPEQSAPLSITAAEQAPPGAESITFTLQDVEVEGAHAVLPAALAAAYRADIGKTVSLSRVYAIANAMTATYRAQGYLLASVVVPVQTITAGRVRLQVIEGYLHAVSFEGYQGLRAGMFAATRARLLADRPLRTATLERALLLLNGLPGIHAEAILHPAADAAGAADLVIRIQRTTVNLTAGFNTRGATVEGPNQIETSVALNSLFGTYNGLNFQYLQATDSSKLKLYALSDVERLTASGLDLLISGSHSEANPQGVDLAAYNLATDTTLARIELDFPFALARTNSLTGHLALTYTDAKIDLLGANFSRDKLSAVRVGLRWDHLDGAYGVNLINAEYSQGLSALGASPLGSSLASRAAGRPNFSKATLYVARLQSLGGPFSVLLAASGQYAFDRLLEPEEFAFGGEPFGRAYDPSEFVGDSGLAGKVEFRYTFDLPVGVSATLYAFADRGEAWRRLLPGDTGAMTEAASSSGGGVRVSVRSWLTGYVEVAKPLDHVVAALGNEDTRVFAGVQLLLGF